MLEGQLVGLLTENQKDQLENVLYMPDVYYNPVLDLNNNWVISIEEINNTTDSNYLWVKELPLIPFEPIQPIPPITGSTL